jgi:hypothetical protein
MDPNDSSQPQFDNYEKDPVVPCKACEAALQSSDRHELSFLLIDQLTVPLVGCDDHLSKFTTVCGYTTENTADLLEHWPAGGISCPSCQLAPYNPHQAVVPVGGGAIGVLACPEHQSDLLHRFQTGLDIHHQLTTPLESSGQPNWNQ